VGIPAWDGQADRCGTVKLIAAGVSTSNYAEIPVQSHRFAPVECLTTSFMRTIRIPLDVYCSSGYDLSDLKFVEFEFATTTAPDEAGSLIIDSIEFTSSPFDDSGNCGAQPICSDEI